MGATLGELSLSDADVLLCGSDLGEAALKIVGATTEDDGLYTCIAVNDMGSASCAASLRVLGKWQPWLVPIFRESQVQSPPYTRHGWKYMTLSHSGEFQTRAASHRPRSLDVPGQVISPLVRSEEVPYEGL